MTTSAVYFLQTVDFVVHKGRKFASITTHDAMTRQIKVLTSRIGTIRGHHRNTYRRYVIERVPAVEFWPHSFHTIAVVLLERRSSTLPYVRFKDSRLRWNMKSAIWHLERVRAQWSSGRGDVYKWRFKCSRLSPACILVGCLAPRINQNAAFVRQQYTFCKCLIGLCYIVEFISSSQARIFCLVFSCMYCSSGELPYLLE